MAKVTATTTTADAVQAAVPTKKATKKSQDAQVEGVADAAPAKPAPKRTKAAATAESVEPAVAAPTKKPAKAAAAKAEAAAPAAPTKKPAKAAAAKAEAAAPAAPAAPTKKPAKVAAAKAEAAAEGQEAKPKKDPKPQAEARAPNVKPSSIDVAGLGVGPAKVKKVLTSVSFNPVEYQVRQAILAASQPPARPQPTSEQSDPAVAVPFVQVPIDQLADNVRAVIQAAEDAHVQSLTEAYETSKLASFSAEAMHAYQLVKTEAVTAAASAGTPFDVCAFNTKYDATFYDGLAAYVAAEDKYAVGHVSKTKARSGVEREREPITQWSRALALVNKSCLRLSSGVRDILACFLDSLVVQYASNGVVNCMAEGSSSLHLRHAVQVSEGFAERVSLDAFARTFRSYSAAVAWLDACRTTRDEIGKLRAQVKAGDAEAAAVPDMPKYPVRDHDESFESYVVEICRSVRMRLAESQPTPEAKLKCLSIKTSESFKRFCSDLIYEAILRIGAHLKEIVVLKSVKTVNDSLIYHTIRQLCNLCGIDYAPILSDMEVRLKKFESFREERKQARSSKLGDSAADALDVETESDADE